MTDYIGSHHSTPSRVPSISPHITPDAMASSSYQDFYFPDGTPVGPIPRHDSYDSAYTSSSSHSYPAYDGAFDHTTPPAPTYIDDDRTPVVTDTQYIHPSNLPQNPASKPLLSPFRTADPYYPAYSQYYMPVPASTNPSPTGSTTSVALNDVRPVRQKVKLTKEDKRNIVELHRTNTSLRQEDIARQYGVDRSTISKIIISAHRWTAPEELPLEPIPRPPKSVGGRFPAVEERMSEWMDMQIAAGLDVRDSVARDQAKAFALEFGLGSERFKASAKWLDKFKDRRRAAGKPVTSPVHMNFGYYPYGPMPHPVAGLSRSHSTMTMSSSSSSQEQFVPAMPERIAMNRSEPDLIHALVAPNRARSQSSPQTLDAMQTPSSGKAVRPSPLSLQRQNSYHGSSPSPRRPAPPSRANSSQGPLRRKPGSLAASAFGITPLDDPASPSHLRQRSECLTPFTASMSSMTLSPGSELSASTSSIATMPMPLSVPPLTPVTPISPNHAAGIFPTLIPDFGEYIEPQQQYHYPQAYDQYQYQHIQQYSAPQAPPAPVTPEYNTMPNKHYAYTYPTSEFGQTYAPARDQWQA